MPSLDREQLVNRITEILLAELEGRPSQRGFPATILPQGVCPDCDAWGACPRHCLAEVKTAFDAGATRAAGSPGFVCPADDGVRSRIDHTLLKPESTTDEVLHLLVEAKENCFASVCINPNHVALAANGIA